ncbi:MAG: Na(+)/H(+) antiporter subunit D [Caldimicrobium sp.]|jgi:multicomponent Na+:H+ antiporter subunit D
MTSIIPPNLIAFIVGPLIYFFYRKSLNYLALFTALLTLFMVAQLEPGIYGGVKILNYEFLLKVDKLSLFFAYVFSLIGFVGLLYALQVEDPIQISAGLLYMACAVGVTLAYDWLSFYLFWEGLGVFSVLLVISARTKEAYYSSIRYILVHAISGLSLLLGILLLWYDYGITKVENLRTLGYCLPYFLILLSFVINAAVPPLNAWLPDAYPNSTIYGSVFLSAFTTKSAVYALVRVFPGEYVLAAAGAIMAFYGVVYATLENNPRRLLSYHIISQVGFMVCGAGLGSAMALNGASAHAFAHIIYKGLLFMSAGAVIYATGIQRIHLLGGFAKKNPWIALYFFIGALSISGVPLTSGFVSKSITIHASTLLHRPFEYLLMELASIGTFFSIVLKMGYYIFFGKEGNYEARPIPWNMHLAMIIASLLCILIGIFPQYYYQFLPYSEHYEPYTYQHTVGVISLFSCVALVFFVVRYYIAPKPKINLDTDWFYIILGRFVCKILNYILEPLEYKYVGEFYKTIVDKILVALRGVFSLFNDSLLISLNLSFPKNIYTFSVKETRFFDGNLLKYLQIFILAIIFFYILGLISF